MRGRDSGYWTQLYATLYVRLVQHPKTILLVCISLTLAATQAYRHYTTPNPFSEPVVAGLTKNEVLQKYGYPSFKMDFEHYEGWTYIKKKTKNVVYIDKATERTVLTAQAEEDVIQKLFPDSALKTTENIGQQQTP